MWHSTINGVNLKTLSSTVLYRMYLKFDVKRVGYTPFPVECYKSFDKSIHFFSLFIHQWAWLCFVSAFYLLIHSLSTKSVAVCVLECLLCSRNRTIIGNHIFICSQRVNKILFVYKLITRMSAWVNGVVRGEKSHFEYFKREWNQS